MSEKPQDQSPGGSPPRRDDQTLARLGGQAAVRDWVERFYGRIGEDPLLAGLFPPDLTVSMEKQYAFFVQYFGGPPLYNEKYGPPFLRYQHRKVKIGLRERDAWMKLLLATLREVVSDEELIGEVERRVGAMADHMINHHPQKKDAYFFN